MTTTRPVLITGAAGFVGSHLLDLVEQEGEPVVAWRRPGEPLPAPPTGASCRWMEVDVLDQAAVLVAVTEASPRSVFHLAGAANVAGSWDGSAATLAVNAIGTCNVLSAVAALGHPCRVLVTGSALVYRAQDRAVTEDDPLGPASPYAVSKLAQEIATRRAGVDQGVLAVATRSFNHIGPRQHPSFFSASFARQIARIEAGLAPPELTAGNLDARRDLTDVRDIVRAYLALMEHGRPGKVYNVCSGRPVRIGDVLDGLLGMARVRIATRRDPSLLRHGDPSFVLGDPGRLREATGWQPTIPLSETLADLIAYWRSEAALEVAGAPGPRP